MDITNLRLQVSIDCLPGQICHGQRSNALHLTLLNTNRRHALTEQQAHDLSHWLRGHGYQSTVSFDEVTLKIHTKERAVDLIRDLDHARLFDGWTADESTRARISTPCNNVEKLVRKIEQSFDDYFKNQGQPRSSGRG